MCPSGRPSDIKFLDAFIKLSHELNLTMREDALVKMFSDVFDKLLPGRFLSIRLIGPEADSLQLVYANGRLRDEDRERFFLTADAFEGLKLSPSEEQSIMDHGRVTRSEEYHPVFTPSAGGFEVALCDRKRFYGLLNLEYDRTPDSIAQDRRVALPWPIK